MSAVFRFEHGTVLVHIVAEVIPDCCLKCVRGQQGAVLGVLGQATQGLQDVGLLNKAGLAKQSVDRQLRGHAPGRPGRSTAGRREAGL